MKNTGMTRPLDQLGRIVLPKEMRTTMDINIGDSLEFFVNEEGFVLRKYTGVSCKFCGAVDHLTYFRDNFICSDCIQILKTEEHEDVASTDAIQSQKHAKPTHNTTTWKPKQSRVQQDEMVRKLRKLIQEHPNLPQKVYAEMLGISQGRVSQLKKLL
ncbi:AbrB/MazE/SpoVT family DNA-binding domain-containing protein [Paenibacillus farraposensis]|uniref:AbrB/MazE/SpoVT family DNA-binding domain-containing protein n=1 Tax=Paenibacillus farraposensis TaxID=2807095 RepID=A0ABW4DG92_9BACL|nr:AbrB/MazE/SpoVT family DNA-binding domain-containing protein [Paenibacillus farraposensis]MCC3379330.1 AbrB/MazE/SpoVT family DNA-binding domain-containing protein [Paenibacillus farraposensis]